MPQVFLMVVVFVLPLVSVTHSQNLILPLPARERGWGGMWVKQKIHLAFDLIKVQELTNSGKKDKFKIIHFLCQFCWFKCGKF